MDGMNDQKASEEQANSGQQSAIPEIHAHEAHRKYKLIRLDNSAIEQTAAEIIEASKLLSNRNLWKANFIATIQRVQTFCNDHRDTLLMALVDVRSNKVLFYFVPKSDRYDLKLGDEMTALEVELGGSAGIGYVETLQVPERSLERFAGARSLLVWKREAESA